MTMQNVEDIYQLSPVQEAMLASERLGQMSCALSGALDITALEWAWQQVLNRHSILRTSFAWKRLDKPLQIVNRELSLAIQIHDLESASEEDLSKLRREELAKEIDPSVAPLARVVLCRTSPDSAHLILTYHPLILDERSVSLLLHEVLNYYASAGNGRNPQLASSSSFWSYVSWVKEQDLAGAESFWRESLRDFKGQTPLEEVYSRGDLANQPIGYDQAVTEIPRDSFAALEALADRLQVTLETLMHGAWALLLHRESGDEDLVYGYAETPENVAANALGPLSTTLPVRVRIDAHTPAGSLIKSLEKQLNEIRGFAFCNLNELPLLQSVVSDHLDDYIEVHGSNLKALNIRTFGPVDVPIVVNLPKPTAPQLRIRYDRTLFTRETIETISAHFQTLLSGLISNPEQPVLNLPFLTAAEVEQLSVWNQTATTYPRESCIHRLFEQQVDERPQEIAVVFEESRLSYAELNERANQLAHHLRLLGVQPETRIALCVERSLEMMVGMLGILKAGGAYAPLDPSHPLERLSFMLEDLQAPVVLTQQHLLDKLPAHWGQVVCLDADWETISLQSTHNPINEVMAENLAYVMYTSGSTGTPKGVSVSHRAVVRLVKNTGYVRLGPDEVFLQFAPISFDASILEIWGCLLNGGRLAVMPPSLPSLAVLGEALRKHGVTTLWLTAGLFHLMVDERFNDLQPVRQLVAGGDALSAPHVRKVFQGLPSCQLINGYGPTEGTTFTCCYPVKDMAQLRTSVPIGRPIANTQAFILDRYLRPVPAGVVGELYIGGDGLARDYLNRPDLTAERFIPCTQGDVPGARVYKTGDLVRYLPDGNIEFLGRRDLQVKIRGFRIELGEVEAALSSHPALQDAVVVARAEIAGEKQLAAYLVGVEGKSVSIDELRDFLRQKLPEHMVPASFVWLEAFPLTANGKVDRQALPAPETDRRGLAQDFVAPRTEMEELLAVIWSQALGVDQVGIDDNFFSLGGDSIRSVQVLARVQERGLSLSLQDLFQYQTIRELAKIATAADRAGLPEPTRPFSLISDQDRLKLPDDVEDAYPLTMLQAGMVFHSELNPGTAVYHDIFSHHLRAPYNPDALRKAMEVLSERHSVLRTCFVLQGFSEPLQLVRRAVEMPIEMGDLRDLSPSEQDRFLRDRVEIIRNRVFDWGHAPLINVEVYRRAGDSFQFTLSFHHAILDGWSLVSMFAELFQLYFSFIDQESPAAETAPLVGSYRDYVAMELQALRSEACRDYWTGKLRGSSPAHLPHWPAADDDRDSDAQVHRIDVAISAEVSARLKDLARSASVPIKSVLLAAHLKVMSFISGESDIMTGLVSNGRPEEGDGERLLGLFLNTIPFRQQLSRCSWINLVQQTFQNEWEALPFRWYPLAQMQREQGSQPLFETAFNFTHFHVASQLQARRDVELLDSISFERTNLPLVANFNLDLSSSAVRLLLVTDGAAGLTKKQTEAIADYYLKALTAMAGEPEAHHQSTSLLSESALHQLLHDWNSTAFEYPSHYPVTELFERQAVRVPTHIAVEFEGEQLSYGELNSRANQLAHYLSDLGVGPEVLVGICVERSVEMVVAVLGVLKAGGAYLPLDPAYPVERLAFISQDAGVSVLLLQQGLLDRVPADEAAIVLLDADWERIAQASGENLEQRATADNLAYVIYTSGSTGKPKGVQVSHGALVNFLNSMQHEPGLTEADALLAVTTLSFDISALELYLPLIVGARLVIAGREATADGAELLKKLETVTAMQATPTTWRLMLAAGWERRLPVKVLCGGEALPPDLAVQLLDRAASLWNVYGPTETTIWSALDRVEPSDGPIVSIGRPIANTQIYLLGSNLDPVPIGVAGELYIGGDGVARGYLHRPDLTAERFGPDPFSRVPGARLYKTGDLARFRPDGRIECLGRLDHQVKVRGFRIELGEIESQLLSHPGVREAVVLARHDSVGDPADDRRLVAYLVAASMPGPSPESLRRYLVKRLPEYMLPSAYVELAEMPLTPSGKVNRLALPAPGRESLAISHAGVIAPRSEIEQLLHSIWAAVLKVENFGIHDNFFALGGHSLLATQVVTRLREALQLAMPLRQLFTHPTVARLARWVETALREENSGAPPLGRVSRNQALPLSFAQQRLWFIDQLEPGSPLYNMPLAMRLHGALDVPVLERAISEIVRRHEVLRTSFTVTGEEPVQVIAAAEPVRLQVKDLSGMEAEQREQAARELVQAEAQKPFDVSRGPLLRALLLRLDQAEHIAQLTMHHIVSDGWSLRVLLREVALLYRAYARGEVSPLPELEIQYADYAVWQREWLQGEELEQQLGYWRKQLSGAPAVLELPQDHARPAVQTHQGATQPFVLGAEVSEGVRQLSRAAGMTTFMVLLAAWQVLLKGLSGTVDISVGTAVAGRTDAALEPLIGFFVNTLVLRTDLSGDPTFAELLERVREVCVGAYGHQEVPFEKLVEELAPERSLAHTPLFQVMLVMQQQQQQEVMEQIEGLTMSGMAGEGVSAKYDLTLHMREAGGSLGGELEYNTDIFEAERAQRIVEQWQGVLAAAVAQPQRRISELPLLSEAERQQLLVEWNDTAAEYPSELTLPQLFEAQVARTPEAVALISGNEQISYKELNHRANQLAHHLVSLGIGPEQLVGVCVERSVEMVVALLGVLKAGAAYLPLDPSYPAERLSFMVQDAEASVLLLQERLKERLPADGATVVLIDTDWERIAQQSAGNLPHRAMAGNLAYVSYTSGSTGRPKGVQAIHSAVINRLNWMWQAYPFETSEIGCLKTRLSFADSVWELFGPMLQGVAIVIIPEAVVQDPFQLIDVLAGGGVSRIVLVPSLLRVILNSSEDLEERLSSVKYWVTSGEALPEDLCREFHQRLPQSKLLNLYGSSEVSADVTWYETTSEETTPVPIGVPISNTRIYILDEQGQPVPVGVAGDLYVGGEGLARGYWRQAGLTAERFVPDSLSGEPGERLFATGDRARYRESGQIEYLGRLDHQVKVRGFRIELGEIETQLLSHPDVREAVVLARHDSVDDPADDPADDRRLVAYVVAASTPGPERESLREYLAERLPEYMLPSAFVLLDEMPLTPSGKVNRLALPAPGRDALAVSSAGMIAPRTEIEQLLHSIWSGVLKVESFSIHDNFFALGGHSLLATQVATRLRQALRLAMPLRQLFTHPTVAQLGHWVETALREENSGAPPLQPADRTRPLPLSFAQQRLWFIDQLEPGSSLYNMPLPMRLRGVFQVEVLERAITEIVRRHEVLRTSFALVGEEPVQVIAAAEPVQLQVKDLSEFAIEQREQAARELVQAEARRPFDLSRGPLLRALVVRLNEEEHLAMLTMHHVISDGWSMGVLLREVAQTYRAYARGEASPLPELEIQYADYAVWQREWLQGDELEQQLCYWRKRLSGAPAVLELPQDHARPAVQTHQGATQPFVLGAEVSEGVRQLSRAAGMTTFMVLLAAWQVLLKGLSGTVDISVGTAVAGRTDAALEPLIGFFVNTLVLRTDLSGDPTFAELLERVREVCVGAYGHQEVPFEKLVEELAPERSMAHAPLFQVMMVMQQQLQQGMTVQIEGLTMSRVADEGVSAKYDLTLYVNEAEGVFRGELEYNTDIFEAERAQRMVEQWQRVLAAAVSQPQRRISELPLLSEAERQQLLVEWNDTAAEYPSELTLPQLFEAQVERTPEAVALISGNERISYEELNRRANQLAHHLVSLGVGPEQLVGVCVERSVEMVVALLGTLKTGAAYLPLDPQYPWARLHFMIEDAGVHVLVTQQQHQQRFAANKLEIICLDTDAERIAEHTAANPLSAANAGNLAYVIYTSGSTGQPKGVAIEHRSASALIEWAISTFSAAELAGVLASTSISFDLSIFELFVPLASGGTVILAENALHLPQLPAASEVTLINTVPSAMAELVRMQAVPASVRTVNLAGEPLANLLVQRIYEEQDRVERVLNLYGPTEDTTYSTWAAMARDAASQPNIGRPIANGQVYILDAQQQPVPVGVTGELYVGGEGVARGYLNRPALTGERFVPHAFSEKPGARLYRTGDLARYLPNGEIEFLDRIDHQVKIRGFRIELGEIEARLLEHPEVSEAVVLARQEDDDMRLVAYLVGESVLRPESLRAHVRETLPDYMVPSAFVLLDELPLTPNGKVDRRALPDPGREALAVSQSAGATARTEIEQLLHSIWSGVLKVETFGIHDNFFALGGHSLLAMQVITRMRSALNIPVPLRELFMHPTVAELGRWVETALRDERSGAPQLQRVQRTRPLPLSFAQQRLWFIDQLEPGSPVYNMPLAVRLRGALDVPVLEQSISEIVRRHEVLRTTFELINGEPVQVIGTPESLRVEVTDLSELAGDERDNAAIELANTEARRPFDLARGPLLRVRLLRLKDDEHLALLTMHHVISDGWSMELLLREVATIYGAFSRDESSPLPELEVQYGDYAVWQREWLRGEELERQASYWRQQLSGAPAVLELPQDHPRPPVQTHNGATHKFVLDSEISNRVRELDRETGLTTFMVLLAAWQVLLKRLSGASDVCVGTVVAGRTHPEVEPLIGFFVNTLVLRANMSGDPTFAELLQQVREVCLEAYSHQDVPFEKLVEELAPERSMAHAPLFQVMMVMQQQQQQEAIVPVEGLTMSGVEAEGTSAKYDLTMYLRESQGVISGALEYNTDIFEAERAQRMVEQWQRVLAAAVAQPQRRISELPLLSDEERQQLLVQWNDTAAEYRSELTLPQLFEAQVERTPEAVALISGNERISYEELNRRANQLAHHLVSLGVGPEQLVGVCVERSVEMVVALLGTLKTGAAYLPLDPQYPWARLHFMIEDAGVHVLVTQQQHQQRFAGDKLEIICLDTDAERIAEHTAANPLSAANAGNLAYVIYTSGSTGQPKGVAIEHRSASALIEWAISTFSAAELSGVLASTSISFDLSIFELFVPLASGGTVILAENALHLPQLPAASEVTLINTVPSAMAELVRMQAVPASVRTVNLAGEPLASLLVQRIYEEQDRVERVLNLYGPTEDTTYSTWAAMARDAASQPNIGRPIANGQVYILDAQQQPVPVGVTGELYVGGEGVARGYLNRPALTAERFVPHAFSENPGARLYRTGDLARYLPNGEIEFLGRMDHQVKIRGFRIELGEIEARLLEHPEVSEAVVLARQEDDDVRLVAYLVSESVLRPESLRAHVRETLPDYMTPSAFVLLDELPLTPNGKVDRRALREREPDALVTAKTLVAPRDVVELQLAQIWEDVLGVKSISVTDNFFDLGGHSFLAVRLMARIKEETGKSLPLALLMQEGTIESLASELRQKREPVSSSPLVAIRREGSAPAFFCVHPAGGNVLCYASLAHHLGPARPFYGFQARGLEDGEEPFTSIEAAASHYLAAMRAIQPEGPYLIGGWSIGGLIAFEMVRLIQAQQQQVALLALFDSHLDYDNAGEEHEAALLINSALHMGLRLEDLQPLRESLRALNKDAQLDYALDHLRRHHLLPPGVEASQIRALLRVFKANLQAARNYLPRASRGRITLFKANELLTESAGDPAAEWSGLALDGFEVREIPGDHFTMMREPHVRVLAEHLNECLQQHEALFDRAVAETA